MYLLMLFLFIFFKAFNINHENAHRALSDVLSTYGILKILAKRIDAQNK